MPAAPRRALPGFRLSLSFALTYLSILVLIPLAGCVVKATGLSGDEVWEIATSDWALHRMNLVALFKAYAFWETVTSEVALHAYRLSFLTAFFAALLNGIFGLLAAWVLVRYQFPGRKILDALVDLPLALPTAVAGITFATLYSPEGWFGQHLGFLEPDGVVGHWFGPQGWFGSTFFTLDTRSHKGPCAIVLVLMFVSLPFVIRSVQPVLAEFEAEQEEAAASLGASRWQTFRKIILPALIPAWLTGFALAYARGLGEYGSIIFVASNRPKETMIPPLLIVEYLDGFAYEKAAAIAVVLLFMSLVTLMAINLLERWSKRHETV